MCVSNGMFFLRWPHTLDMNITIDLLNWIELCKSLWLHNSSFQDKDQSDIFLETMDNQMMLQELEENFEHFAPFCEWYDITAETNGSYQVWQLSEWDHIDHSLAQIFVLVFQICCHFAFGVKSNSNGCQAAARTI